jgi:hypothetical protein
LKFHLFFYSFYRNIEASGFLNKRRTGKKEYKRFWFILSRPYLYFAKDKNMENEKVIELTNSKVAKAPEEVLYYARLDLEIGQSSFEKF